MRTRRHYAYDAIRGVNGCNNNGYVKSDNKLATHLVLGPVYEGINGHPPKNHKINSGISRKKNLVHKNVSSA